MIEPLLKPSQQKKPRQPAIERVWSKTDKCWKEFCRTPAGVKQRRREIFNRAMDSDGVHRCEECKRPIAWDWFHWHHEKLKSQGGDDSMENAKALCGSDCHLRGKHGHF